MDRRPGSTGVFALALTAAAMLVCLLVSGDAVAGPNAGGTLIVHDANHHVGTFTNFCALGSSPVSCATADARVDSIQDAAVFRVYAAFAEVSSPRLLGVTWGISYDPAHLYLMIAENCGDWELNQDGWPGPGRGSTVTWNTPRTAHLVPVYAFAAYTVPPETPCTFSLIPNPEQGGWFGDDSVPPILDPIVGYSSLGFFTDGQIVCPSETPVGACCLPDGSCYLIPQAECTPPNVWQGPWTYCAPNPCPPPPPTGVCCAQSGECTITTQAECPAPNVWHSGWHSCLPNPCPQPPPTGACCHSNGACTITTLQNCSGNWHPEWTSCTPNPCPQPSLPGACCYPNGICEEVSDLGCEASGGEFQGAGTSCTPNPCPLPIAACCYPDGHCILTTPPECPPPAVWYGDQHNCLPNPCPQPAPTGACCHTDGSCTVTTQAGCLFPNVWQGPNTVCSPNPCPQPSAPGACCLSNGTCVVLNDLLCAASLGFFQGPGTVCDPNPCPTEVGACCDPDTGACEMLTEQGCDQAGGIWHPYFTSCDPNPCPPPVPVERSSWGRLKAKYR